MTAAVWVLAGVALLALGYALRLRVQLGRLRRRLRERARHRRQVPS